MRLHFGPGDERAAGRAREELVERFASWLNVHTEEDADPSDASLLLDWKWGYGDGHYGRWTRADVDELLLEHLPRKLSAAPAEAAALPVAVGAFVRFLEDEGLLDPAGDAAEVVARRALAQQRSFLDAMADPANFGMAKRLFDFGGLELAEDVDQATLDAAVARFNELPFEERGRILGLDGPDGAPHEPPPLPPLPARLLPTVDELDAAAAGVLLLDRLDRLLAALPHEGAKLTKAGFLPIAEAKRLLAAVGLPEPPVAIRSSAELPELFALVQVGLYAGAVTIARNRLQPDATWYERAPAERWQELVTAALETGPATMRLGAWQPSPVQLIELADEGAAHFLAMLWTAGEPLPVDEFAQLFHDVAVDQGATVGLLGDGFWRDVSRQRVIDVMTTLAELGVVALAGDDVGLTDAGARLVAPWLQAAGFSVPIIDDLRSATAGDLLDLVVDHDLAVESAGARWVADRPEAAGEMLAELLTRPQPARVMLGFAVLGQLGADSIEAVRAVLDTPLAPQAWMYLAAVDAVEPDDIPAGMALYAGVERFLGTADLGGPPAVIESMLGGLPVDEHPELLAALATTSHPRVHELLELIGRNHPDKAVGKHARKLAHRVRTGGPQLRR